MSSSIQDRSVPASTTARKRDSVRSTELVTVFGTQSLVIFRFSVRSFLSAVVSGLASAGTRPNDGTDPCPVNRRLAGSRRPTCQPVSRAADFPASGRAGPLPWFYQAT